MKPKLLKTGSCKKTAPNRTYKKMRPNGNNAFRLDASTILSVTVYLLPKTASIASKDSVCGVSIAVIPDFKSTWIPLIPGMEFSFSSTPFLQFPQVIPAITNSCFMLLFSN